jgi:ATP synthase protein I
MSPIPSDQRPGGSVRQFAMALELPFLIVGAVLAGGFVGWLLDRWLHTSPWLMIALGSVGFAAGLRDLLKRVARDARDDERPR